MGYLLKDDAGSWRSLVSLIGHDRLKQWLELEPETVAAILANAGLVDAPPEPDPGPEFERQDGSKGHVCHRAQLIEDRPLGPGERYVLQVSRWDRLKDPLGVIDGFAEAVAPHTDAHLIYAGPDVTAVADDPEDLLDHLAMEEKLAARAVDAPTERSAYHAITYGWLVAGLARRVTGGRGVAALRRTEVAAPGGGGRVHKRG